MTRKFSAATTLSDLAEEFDFLAMGLVFLHVPLDFDLIAQFAYETNSDEVPFSLKFDKPIFRGLTAPNGDQDWNHVLFAYPRDAATGKNSFVEWLGRAAFWDPGSQTMLRVRTQQFDMPDPLLLDKLVVLPDELKTVPVTAFILEAQHGWYYFDTRGVDKLELPSATFLTAENESTKAFVKALVDGNPDPYAFLSDQLRGRHARSKGRDSQQ